MRFNKEMSETFGNELPWPSGVEIVHNQITKEKVGYIYMWLLNGYFYTKNGSKYLNDIIARMIITFQDVKVEKERLNITYEKSYYHLKDFQNLKSIQAKVNNYLSNESVVIKDQVFWCLKLYAESMISKYKIVIYQELESFAYQNFIEKKGMSDLRCKCRSIFNWYEKRDFQPSMKYQRKLNDEELKMSRSENMSRVRKLEAAKNYKKIINTITGLGAAEMFQTKSKKWNASKIANYLKIDPRTVRKHLKDYQDSLN